MSLPILMGAFVAFYPATTLPRTIVFQINPESLKRTIVPIQSNVNLVGFNDVRERISFVLSVDENMGDDYFVQTEQNISHGVLPFLSAIELLVYPSNVINNESSTVSSGGLFGFLNNIGSNFRNNSRGALPFVNLVFGAQRIIPVKIQSIDIIEQAFGPELQPIRASIEIVMDVLTERESKQHPTINESYLNYLRLKVMLAGSK